jgi:hypothetical protein
MLNHVTLDGVMQAPGRADDDTRDGFRHGGWSPPCDDVMARAINRRWSEQMPLMYSLQHRLSLVHDQIGPSKRTRVCPGSRQPPARHAHGLGRRGDELL